MPLDASLRDRITASVAAGFDDQVAFTQDLIRFPSVRGEEQAIQDHLFRAFRERGLAMDRFAMDRDAIAAHPGGSKITERHSKAPIVVGIHRPREETGRSLILQSHVDVVPPGPADMWSAPPFDPVIRGDWLYGRGGADMKAGTAANLFCLDALRRIGLQPAATVTMQSVVEEESTGNGALMTHLRGYRADAVLIPEPEDEKLVRANTGVLWFEVEVRGMPVHVREMGAGQNAIDAAYRVVGALRELEARWNADKAGRPHFEADEHPINLNIGRIEGGDWASSVPGWCRLSCRLSFYPGIAAAEAAREVEAAITAFSRTDTFLANNPPQVRFDGFFAEGYVLEEGSEAERVLGEAHRAATGADLQSFMTAGYLDARVYALYDRVPTLCYGPVSRNIHGYDECVSLSSLKRITTAMALFVAEWCGVRSPELDLAALRDDDRVLWSEDVLRFCDTDANGHVNNAAFAMFCESGRVNALRTVLQPTCGPDTFFSIAKLTIEYRAELHHPGRVRCGTWFARLGTSSVDFAQALLDDDGRLAATSHAVTVLMDAGTRRPRQLPPETRDAVEAMLRGA